MRSPRHLRSPAQPQRKLKITTKSPAGKGQCRTNSPKKNKKTIGKFIQRGSNSSNERSTKVNTAKAPVAVRKNPQPLKKTPTLASGRSLSRVSATQNRGSGTGGGENSASPGRLADLEPKSKSPLKPCTKVEQPNRSEISQSVTRHSYRQPGARLTQLPTPEKVNRKSQKTEEVSSSDEDEEVSVSTQIRRSSRSSAVAKDGSQRLSDTKKKNNNLGSLGTKADEGKNKNSGNSSDFSRRSARSQSTKPKFNAENSDIKSRESSRSSTVRKVCDQQKQSKTSQLDQSKVQSKSKSEKTSNSCNDNSASDPKDHIDTRVTRRNASNNAKVTETPRTASKGRRTPISVSTDEEEDTQESNVVEVDDPSEDSESEVQEVGSDTNEDSDSDIIWEEDENRKHKRPFLTSLKTLKAQYGQEMKAKDEELQRLRRELEFKDGHLAEMKILVETNLELNARISAMLSDREIYENECRKFCDSKDFNNAPKPSKSMPEEDVKDDRSSVKTSATKNSSERNKNHTKSKEKSVTKKSSTKDQPEASDKSMTGRGKRNVETSSKTSTTEKTESKEGSQEADESEVDESEAEQTITRRSKRNRKDSHCGSQEKSKSPKKEKKEKRNEKDSNSSKSKMEKSDGNEEDFEEEESPGRKQRKRKSTTADGSGKSKKARKSKRKKKGETSDKEEEEDDIDALFVSDKEEKDEDSDDVEIIDDPGKSEKEQASKEKDTKKKDKGIKSPKHDDNDEEEKENDEEDGKGRHNIRKLMTGKKLTEETKAAAKSEKDRRERVDKEHEKHLIEKAIDPKTKIEICTKLVLAFKEGTKKPTVEVLPKLVKKLKPHQVEAVEFMWDNLIECLDKLNDKNPGQGCILAHCMGLGKTLSVIALVHTLLTSKAVGMKTCLVVCPLNTVLNWQYEWHKWLDKKDRLPTYELASCRNNNSRADLLAKWQKYGGVMIIGYSLFRILASYSGKSKKAKTIFEECLLDPGPDLVICDEGHILKNDASALSKWMSKIRSQRRVVLTGTPLQNNLIEYHCMANFVKPLLLGTRREFSNRFVNPITNGQHSDSTARDVKLMKRRAHILHETLAGCVQRRNYSALSKFLPPKEEYVISVRLSALQISLYRKYLETFRSEENLAANQTHSSFKIRGASLFTDYQALMRVWTHPWVLKLDALRQERKAFAEQDDELDSLDDTTIDGLVTDSDSEAEEGEVKSEDSEEEGLVIDASDLSSAEASEATRSQPKRGKAAQLEKEDKAKKRKKKKDVLKSAQKITKVNGETSKAEDGSSKMSETESSVASDTEKTKVLGGEVIRSWKTTSRHGKQDAINQDDLLRKDTQWWTDLIDEDIHKTMVELSGKLVLLFEILRMAEGLGDKVLVFSQSILSLDLIEEFLKYKDEEAQKFKGKKADKPSRWVKDEDYYRMDGSTGVQNRRKFTSSFNMGNNDRMRLFLISTRAGGLGINLDSANRVIIFDASWNPSHDIQSIFRVYRFGQEKDVYVYRFVAQGTMEEKIYDRQVTKETLSQRVIDEHQIDRHFTANDLQELYIFKPDDVTDPDRVTPPVPKVPKDLILAELLSSHPEWIYGYHEHDSLLENRPEENLSEEERKAAWEEYERDKQGLITINNYQPRPFVPQPYMTGPNIRPPVGGPATAQLSNLLTTITPYSQPQINMQIQQLPRVVKEILKYNPNITAEELQGRLQSFLGMHTRFPLPSSGAPPPPQQLPTRFTTPSVQPSAASISSAGGSSTTTYPRGMVITQGVPAQGHLPRLVPASFPNPMTLFPPTNMPSRLPTTGFVPALSKKPLPASKSLPHNVMLPKSASTNAPVPGQSKSSQPTASTSTSS